MGPGIIIPARGLADGKRRLATTLSDADRASLNRHLLRHVIGVCRELARSDARSVPVAVVSPDAATLGFAHRCGAMPLLEPHALGLNGAVEWAMRQFALLGAQCVAVIPADLPRLGGDDLLALLDGPADEVLIAPDRTGIGTNGLRLPVSRGFHPAFGPGSHAAHAAAATAGGLMVRRLHRPGLAIDIDTRDDLAAWCAVSGEAWRAEAA
jgi:2-phospho-L-lactate guanylyltransferase